jgi:hypothetical protein
VPVLLQALSGFLMMMTQNGKLLYISDNAAEYLGHSMVSTDMCNVGVVMGPRRIRTKLG